MNTIPNRPADGRRRRRHHSDEFKAEAVAARMHSGTSMAAVAKVRGVNASLLRRWVRIEEERGGVKMSSSTPAPVTQAPAFVPLQLLAATSAPSDIRIELRRGGTTVSVSWPTDAAAECAAWMLGLLR